MSFYVCELDFLSTSAAVPSRPILHPCMPSSVLPELSLSFWLVASSSHLLSSPRLAPSRVSLLAVWFLWSCLAWPRCLGVFYPEGVAALLSCDSGVALMSLLSVKLVFFKSSPLFGSLYMRFDIIIPSCRWISFLFSVCPFPYSHSSHVCLSEAPLK